MQELKSHILVVDDDKGIRTLLKRYLVKNEFIVSEAEDASKARELLKDFAFDLLILDVMMPNENGVDLATGIRQNSDVPIIMLTAMGEVEHKITGLESGVDDYIVKPFEPKELLLRIKNILYRVNKQQSNIITLGSLTYHTDSGRLFKGVDLINLTSNETTLLKILSKSPGKIITREELSEKFEGINERSVDVQIIRLRNKIEQNPKKPVYLQTVRGKGYVLYAD